ncbi:MAG: cysteine desulfurase family protein, partial [Planctomycetota bacterium]
MTRSLRPLQFDHNASTPVDAAVLQEMLPFLAERAGNPSSAHSAGREARVAVERARARVAGVVGARPDQVVLTGGGTEANNLAVLGAARAAAPRGRHVLASAVEHASVLGPCARLREEGFDVEVLPVDRDGRVDPDRVAGAVRRDTTLLCVMAANNETGALQPVLEILRLLPDGVLLHCDATQLPGKVPLGEVVRAAHLVTLSSHKVHGPKGAGALVVRA